MKTKKLFSSIPILFVLLLVAFFAHLSVSAGNLIAEQQTTLVYLPLIQKYYAPAGSGYGNVTGQVRDARTGTVIAGIKVCLEGSTSCPLTNVEGKYTLQNIPNGTRKLIATDPSGIYLASEELVVVAVNTTVEQNFNLLQGLEDDQMRVVVTWDDVAFWPPSNVPNDLNLHMWWSDDNNATYQRVDIDHRGNCQDLEVFPFACYENDEWYGNGPDTIAFQLRSNVVYYFAVLNYYAASPGVPSLKDASRSPRPRVEVYDGYHPIPIHEIEIDPIITTGDGDMWFVFKLDYTDYLLQNCMTQFVLPGDTPPNDACVTLKMFEKQPERR